MPPHRNERRNVQTSRNGLNQNVLSKKCGTEPDFSGFAPHIFCDGRKCQKIKGDNE